LRIVGSQGRVHDVTKTVQSSRKKRVGRSRRGLGVDGITGRRKGFLAMDKDAKGRVEKKAEWQGNRSRSNRPRMQIARLRRI
jgi:hypothetical protein